MGRLAAKYADLDITTRFPYAMPGELTQAASVSNIPFNNENFLNVQDKVFECHRLIPRVWALDSNGVLLTTQPDQLLLQGLVLTSINLQGFNQLVTKAQTRLGTLLKGSAENTWEFADPFYLPNGRGVQAFITTTAFPAIANLSSLLVAFTFEGFLLQTQPARGF